MKKLITFLMMAFAVVAVSCADEEDAIVNPPTPVNLTAAQVEASLGGLILTGDAVKTPVKYTAGVASGLETVFEGAKKIEDLQANLLIAFNKLANVGANSYVKPIVAANVVLSGDIATGDALSTLVIDDVFTFTVTIAEGTKKVSGSVALPGTMVYTFTVTDGTTPESDDTTLALATKAGETELGNAGTTANVDSVVTGALGSYTITSTGALAADTQAAILAAVEADVPGLNATSELDATDLPKFIALLGEVAAVVTGDGKGEITKVTPDAAFADAGGTVAVVVTAEDGTIGAAVDVIFVFTAGTD